MSEASFDSNILIDALRNHEAAQAELERVETRWISRLTWIEVLSKVDESTRARTEALLSAFAIDEVTVPIATQAATLCNARRSLKLPDAVILASAQVHDRLLVTRNTKDFPADMPGVRVPYSIF